MTSEAALKLRNTYLLELNNMMMEQVSVIHNLIEDMLVNLCSVHIQGVSPWLSSHLGSSFNVLNGIELPSDLVFRQLDKTKTARIDVLDLEAPEACLVQMGD